MPPQHSSRQARSSAKSMLSLHLLFRLHSARKLLAGRCIVQLVSAPSIVRHDPLIIGHADENRKLTIFATGAHKRQATS